AALGSSNTTASTEYTAWTTTTSKLKLVASSVPEDIPKVSPNQEWFKPLSEKERPATPEPAWSIPSSSLPVPDNNWASALASSFVPPLGELSTFTDR
ncbi:hypothetical protein Tco_0391451, partial [Tanacetum coccineum]